MYFSLSQVPGPERSLVSQAMLLTPCHLPVPWLPQLGLGPCPQGCGNTEDGPGSQQAVSLGVGMGVPLCTLTQYLLCPAQAQQGGQGVDHRQCCPHSVWRSLQALEYLTWPLLKKPETSYPHTGFGLLRMTQLEPPGSCPCHLPQLPARRKGQRVRGCLASCCPQGLRCWLTLAAPL